MNTILLFTACCNIVRKAPITRGTKNSKVLIRRLAETIYDSLSKDDPTWDPVFTVEAPKFVDREGARGLTEDALFDMVCKHLEENLPQEDRYIATHAAAMIWIQEADRFYERINVCIAAYPDDRDAILFIQLLKDGLKDCDFRDGSEMFSNPMVGGTKHLYSGRKRIADSDVQALENALESNNVIEVTSVMATAYKLQSLHHAPICVRIDIEPGCWDPNTGASLGQIICKHVFQNATEYEVIVFPGSRFTVVGKIAKHTGGTEYVLKPIIELGNQPVVPVHMGVEFAQCHECGGLFVK